MSGKTKTYLTLFYSSFYISALTFGSGYVIVSVIKKRFVDDLGWIDEKEMMNLMALAQSSPGAIAANTALLVGFKICGAMGAFLSVLGMALPPLVTIFIISLLYDAIRDNTIVSAVLMGMQIGACAVIADVIVTMFISVIKDKEVRKAVKAAIMICAFAAAFVLKINFVFVVLFFILVGLVWFFVEWRIRKRA